MNNASIQIYKIGYKYLRFEKWIITLKNVTNIFYGFKLLRWKVFVCDVIVRPKKSR